MTTEQGTCVPCSGTGLRDAVTLCPTCEGSGGRSQPADRDPDPVVEAPRRKAKESAVEPA